jgi:hypothetical protein
LHDLFRIVKGIEEFWLETVTLPMYWYRIS